MRKQQSRLTSPPCRTPPGQKSGTTLRTAYDQAMGKMRRQFTLTPVGKPIIPDKVSWLNSELLKTRVAHIPWRYGRC